MSSSVIPRRSWEISMEGRDSLLAHKKQHVKVSIIIPVYCVSAYVERCIRSVMNQTYTNIESIIVDDATPDDSIEKCECIIDDYQGPILFSILHHQQNRGLSAARNTGTKAATGDYVFYLDSDDAISADCIEKLVRPVLKDASIEMVMGGFVRCSDCYPIISRLQQYKKGKEIDLSSLESVRDYWFSRKGFNVYTWNKLVKKDFLHQYRLHFKEGLLYEDILWNFYAMKYLRHFYVIPDVTYFYYRRPFSITTGLSPEEKALHFSAVYEEIANHFTEKDSRREAKHYVRGFCFNYINNPKIPSFALSAQKIRKELSIWKDPFELVLLSSTKILSKFSLGHRLFHSLVTTNKRLLEMKDTLNQTLDTLTVSNHFGRMTGHNGTI